MQLVADVRFLILYNQGVDAGSLYATALIEAIEDIDRHPCPVAPHVVTSRFYPESSLIIGGIVVESPQKIYPRVLLSREGLNIQIGQPTLLRGIHQIGILGQHTLPKFLGRNIPTGYDGVRDDKILGRTAGEQRVHVNLGVS